MGECPRGGFCNFMHLKPISNSLRKKLYSVKYQKERRYDEAGYEGGYEMASDYYSPKLMAAFGGGGSHYDDATGGMNGNGRGGSGGGGRYRSRSRSPGRRRGGGGSSRGGGGGGYSDRRY